MLHTHPNNFISKTDQTDQWSDSTTIVYYLIFQQLKCDPHNSPENMAMIVYCWPSWLFTVQTVAW